MCEPIQTNNGYYILFEKVDKDTINEIYNFLKTKLISFSFKCLQKQYIYICTKMNGTKRVGRPMTNNKVEITNLLVEFLSRRKHDYNVEICYMKVVDKEVKKNETNYCFG